MDDQRLRLGVAGPPEECCAVLAALTEPCCSGLAEVVALAASDRRDSLLLERLEELARKPSLYLRVEELLANETLHALVLASAPGQRPAHAAAALCHGCHVLVRSPPALTVRAAQRLLKTAEQNDRFVGVYRSGKFGRRAEILRWAVASRIFGNLSFAFDAAFGLPGAAPNLCVGGDPKNHNRTQGGGLLLVRSLRDLAFLRYVCGEVIDVSGTEAVLEPERIVGGLGGEVRGRFAVQAEDTAAALLRFANGAHGLYLRSWCGRGSTLEPTLCLWGTKGCVRDETLFKEGAKPEPLEELWKDRVGAAKLEALFPGGMTDPFVLELSAFLKTASAWKKEKKLPPNALREAVRDLALTWAVAEAHALGRRVSVAEVENLTVEQAQHDLNVRWKTTSRDPLRGV